MQSILHFLKTLGLNEKEINIYVTLLQLGLQATTVIAKKTDLPRSSTDFQLKNLVKKGFVKREVRANLQYFSAVLPEEIKHMLERDKKKTEDKLIVLNELLPEFKKFSSVFSGESKVSYFEGLDGICKMLDLAMHSQEDLYLISNHHCHPKIQRYLNTVCLPARKEAKTRMEMIITSRKQWEDISAPFKSDSNWLKVIKTEVVHFESSIAIYGNNTMFLSTHEKDLTGVLMVNLLTANTMRTFFQMIKTFDQVDFKGKLKIKSIMPTNLVECTRLINL